MAANGTVEKKEIVTGAWYKLVVYDADGNLVKAINYKYKDEGASEPLFLTVGEEYNFVSYSVNSTDINLLPALEYSDPTHETLENSYITSLSSTNNATLLFYKTKHTISATEKNYLNIVFGHVFNEITTTIDITTTDYSFEGTKVVANLIGNSNKAEILFFSEEISSVGTPSPNLTFTYNTDNTIATSTSSYINNNSTSILTLQSITIGPLTNYNINPFQTLHLTPGTKYILNLKITPADAYTTHQGIPVARINGQLWMLTNLGATATTTPNVLDKNIQGDYYQWGKLEPFASGTSEVPYVVGQNPFPKFDTNTDVSIQRKNDWAGGTERNPARGPNDPCPTGFRIPTATEYNQLLSNATFEYQGQMADDALTLNDYGYGLRLTSKRKQSVILTFPAQGYSPASGSNFTWTWRGFAQRGQVVSMNTVSYIANSSNFRPYTFEGNRTAAPITKESANISGNAAYGHPIRCISTKNDTSAITIDDRDNQTSSGNIIFN